MWETMPRTYDKLTLIIQEELPHISVEICPNTTNITSDQGTSETPRQSDHVFEPKNYREDEMEDYK